MISLCIILFFGGIFHQVKSQSGSLRLCSEGYTNVLKNVGGKVLCLRVYSQPATWQQARRTCNAQYSHLATLSERYLSNFGGISTVHESLQRQYLQYPELQSASWVSLQVNQDYGNLLWHSYRPWDYYPEERPLYWQWGSGQPSRQNGSCASAQLTRDVSGTYMFNINLVDCQKLLEFACMNAGFVGLAEKVPRCPDGWFGSNFADVCYKHESEARLPYRQAKANCAGLGGRLAAPGSAFHKALAASASPDYPNDNLPVLLRKRRQVYPCPPDVTCRNGGTCVMESAVGGWYCSCDHGYFGKFCEFRVQPGKGDPAGSPSCTNNPCENGGICRDQPVDIGGSVCYCKYPVYFGRTCTDDAGPRGTCRESPCGTRGDCYEAWSGEFLCQCHHGFHGRQCENIFETDVFWVGLDQVNCVVLNGTEHRQSVADCDLHLPYVCERDALPPATLNRITEQPKNIRTQLADLAEFNWRQIYSGVNIYPATNINTKTEPILLTCGADNYHPEMDIVWIKDGKFLWSAPPPSGFTLTIDVTLLESRFGADYPLYQGYYHCEVWGSSPFSKMISQKALVTFYDVLTFQGTIQALNYPYHLRYVGLTQDEKLDEMLSGLVTYDQPGFNTHAIRHIRPGSGNGLFVDFSIFHLSQNLTEQVLLWKVARGSTAATITELYKTYLTFIHRSILRGMKNLVQDKQSAWFKLYQSVLVQPDTIYLRSASYCMHRVTNEEKRILDWRLTKIGQRGRTRRICLGDGEPLAVRNCNGNFTTGGFWGPISYHRECREAPQSSVTQTLKILAEMDVSKDNVETVSFQVKNLTMNTDILTYTDVVYTSKILENIGQVEGTSTQVGERMVHTVNNVLNVQMAAVQRAQTVDDSSNRIIQALTQYSQRVDLRGLRIRRFIQPNIAMEILEPAVESDLRDTLGFGVVRPTTDQNSTDLTEDSLVHFTSWNRGAFENIDAAIILPEAAVKEAKLMRGLTSSAMDGLRVVYTVYQKKELFLTPSELSNSSQYKTVNSKVISGSIGNIQVQGLNDYVEIILRPIRNATTEEACVYWDFEANNGTGNWSTKGCIRNNTVAGMIVCHCDHLTNFAVLTDYDRSEIDPGHLLALTIITTIGLGLSIMGLFLTILSFILFRKLREGRTQKTLFNLAIALICADIIFLVGIDKTGNFVGCAIVAALLQYFLLAAFMWMLIEGILQYMRYVKVFGTYVHKFTLKAGIPAWLLPAIAVAVVAAVDYNMFRGSDNYCWLSLSAFYYAFLVPVGIIITINFVVFMLIIKSFCSRPKNLTSTQKKSDLILLQVRASLVCLMCMGLTWVFGFLAINDARLVFQYLFCIFNAFQGLFIFLMLNIREKSVRDAWAGICCCAKKQLLAHSSAGITLSSESTNTINTDSSDDKSKHAIRFNRGLAPADSDNEVKYNLQFR